MKFYKSFISLLIFFLICITFIFSAWFLQQNKSLYDQIDKAILESEPDYKGLIHILADRDRTIAFYETTKSELCIVLLKKGISGYKLGDYINKISLYADQDVSWQGSERVESNIHMLFGVFRNPEITQLILISEGDKPAQIINNGEYSIWYYLTGDVLKKPITIQATDKEGRVLYKNR